MERTQLKTVSHRKLGFKVHTHPAILENTRVCFGQLPFSSIVCGDDSYVPPSNIFCESPKRVPCVLCCCEGGEKDSVNSCPKRERKNQTAQTVMRQIHIVQLLHPRFVNGVQRNVVLRGCFFNRDSQTNSWVWFGCPFASFNLRSKSGELKVLVNSADFSSL